jgi:outer membrane protein assembly factor BamB
MPWAVECPACHADGTAAANQIIAKRCSAVPPDAPRLRLHETPSENPPSAAPAPEPPAAPKLDLAGFKAQKRRAEQRAHRKGARLIVGLVILLAAGLGAWAWYSLAGSKPHLAATLKLPGGTPSQIQFLGPGKILIATANEASLRDLSLEKVLWSARLSDAASPLGAPPVFADHDKLWICLGDQVKCLDEATGTVKQTIPIAGRFVSFTPADTSLLVVSAPDETRRIALHIELATGAVSTQEITVPRKEKQTLPNDLPPNVLPTAAVLTAQILEEQKFNKPLNAMSSEFFAAGKNLVELRVKLLEAKVSYVQSIKPRGPPQLNGQTTAGSSAGVIGEEIFNDLKRSETGGVRPVDESRYEVRLRRWIESEPVEWKGEVTGAPSFFPLSTVDLLVAGQTLAVFDKQNQKLFDSKLSYPVSERFTTGDLAGRLLPAAERTNTLYFFDQGVLTAFSLPDGGVRWRLPSFGISAIQFDGQGMLYVDSTAAGPDDIKYADTISFEKIPSVLLKVDPASGKILWKAEQRGERTIVSGKFLYSESVQQGGAGLAAALGDALNQPPGEGPVYFRLYRMDPATGEALWSLYREQGPQNLAIAGNRILLRFGNDLELFKFLAF